MKATRRSFLARVAAIAAVAPLAGSVGPVQAAEEEHDATYEQAAAQCHQCAPDSPFPHVYGHPDTDAIAQARADGYNRGREVEAARWEARFHPVETESWSVDEGRAYYNQDGVYTRVEGYQIPATVRWVKSGDSEPRRIRWEG